MEAQSILLLFSIFLSPLIIVLLFSKKKSNVYKLPPSPPKLPLIGNMHQLGELSPVSLERLAKDLGPMYYLQLGYIPTVIISSPEVAKEIIKNNDQIFSSRPAFYAERFYSYDFHDISFAPYGEYWREARKMLMVEFLNIKKVLSFESIRREEMELMVKAITNYSSSKPSSPIDLSKLAFAYGNNTVCRAAFGKKTYSSGKYDGSNEFHDLIRETMNIVTSFNIGNFIPWLSWLNKVNGWDTRIEKNFKVIDRLFDKVIEDHLSPSRDGLEHEHDVIDAFLRTQKEPNQSFVFSKEQMKGVMQDIFLAGTEAVYSGIIWTMTELIKNPRVMQKAKEEIKQAMKGKSFVEQNDLPNLTYLNKILKESFRLHPPSPLLIPRVTTDHAVVSGYDIPANTLVIFNVEAFASNPKLWDKPNEFMPERFVESAIDFKGFEFETLSFGTGRRVCPGANFGVVAVKFMLANLLYRFDWKLPDGVKIEDIDMTPAPGIVVQKKEHLCLVATPVSA